jgi:PAS domain-containing protein
MPKRKSVFKPPDSKETLKAPRRLKAPYQLLFQINPVPIWVYDMKSLVFLAVNQAAVDQYG